MKKKQFIILVLSAVIAFQVMGCAKKNSTQKNKTEKTAMHESGTDTQSDIATLEEIRAQAKNLDESSGRGIQPIAKRFKMAGYVTVQRGI